MKHIGFLLLVAVADVVAFTSRAEEHSDEEAAPVFAVYIPPGHRD